ncbi:MFS transporter [Vibrio rhizosphaerae]|uniref:MFS transporter n=1 Tax=Vibrio rhizosphaerae TaxID=398736 RepID=A0ABU4IVH2_9VIBR|nr:MFS transporter [Vibrio rhizosphaerae]MDW6093422.1 MFS transporter [Vibrio rhizosphaerae]
MISRISNNIYLYIASDVLSQASYRLFQVFCTWYYIQFYNQEEYLANIMFFIWLANVLFLPISGVILERYRKTFVLTSACLVTFICLVALLIFYQNDNYSDKAYVVFLAASVLLSAASSFIMPLGVSLIPEISSDETETTRGIRIKSSTFIVNLFLGPMLGGFLIGYWGGGSILIAALLFAFFSVVTSFMLWINTELKSVNIIQKNFLLGLVEGVMRTIKIKEERIIAIISSSSNLFLVPFIFLLLPSKVIGENNTMVEVSIIEICIGIGMFLSPTVFIPYLEKVFGKHISICIGQFLIAISIFLFSLTNDLYVQYLLGFTLGVGLNLFNAIINACRAISIPNGYRGAMESSFLLMCIASVPLGFWIAKIYLSMVSVDYIIASSLIIYIPSLLVITISNDIKSIVGSNNDNGPYYKNKYRKLFAE